MMVLVSYDVETTSCAGARRLRRVAKVCKDYGQRVQFSVFECEVDPARWIKMRDRLLHEIDSERDSLRFYFLGRTGGRVEHVGAKPSLDLAGAIIA